MYLYQIAIEKDNAVFIFDGEGLPKPFSDYETIISSSKPVELANEWLRIGKTSIGLKISGVRCQEDRIIPVYVEKQISEISFRGLNIKTLAGETPVIKV